MLHVVEKGYGMSACEGGAVVAGFATSALIGTVYLSPMSVALRIFTMASLAVIAAGVLLGTLSS